VRRICLWALGLVLICCPAQAAERYNFSTANARLTVLPTASLRADTQRDLICLSLNIYHESRGTSQQNQMAVALVTRNRHRILGRSYCDVVYESNFNRSTGKRTHQFSWTAYRRTTALDKPCWDTAQRIAWLVMMDPNVVDITRGATHFHERNISPAWARNPHSRVTIGAHTFLRVRGYYQEVAQAN
jgi:spore germination cell wall hydrolase CwlJ-like protein